MAAPPPVLTVAVERGPRQGESRQCRAGAAVRVGRVVRGNDLALRDGGASQQHLLIEFLPPPGAGWSVSDLGTSNGTILNGAPLVPSVPAPLSHGDQIKVGDSTVLAVSMAPDSNPTPRATRNAAAAAVEEKPPVVTRRGRRNKAGTGAEASEVEKEEPDAVVVEKPPAVTRRGTRSKAPPVAEIPEAEKEEPDAAAVVVEDKPPAVTRRGTRSKALPVAEPPEVEKEEPDAAAVEEMPQVARRWGGRKKVAPGQMDETAEASRQGEQKKAPEPSEPEKEKEEVMVLTRRGSRRSVSETPKPKEDEEENAPTVTRRGGRKTNVATIPPPPLPPKPKSVRGRGTRATASTTTLQEEQGGNELAASRARTANLMSRTAAKGGDEQEGLKVAAGDGGVELEDTANALKEELPKGRANAHRAASDNDVNVAGAEPTGEMEEAAEVICHRRQKKVVEHHEPEKEGGETMVVTRRGERKEVAEQSEPGKDEDTTLVTRRGRGRRKKVAEQPETKKDVEQSTVATRRGRRKKATDQLEPEKEVEETTVVTRRGRQKKVVEQPELVKEDAEKEEGALVLARRGGRKKNAMLVAPSSPELVNEDDEKEEGALALNRRGGSKKNALLVAPPSLPPKMSSTRGQGRVTRASMTVKALEEELPKRRARAKLAASNTAAHVAAAELIVEMEEIAEAPRRGRQKKVVEPPEPEKEDEEKENTIGVTRRRWQKKAAVVACHAGRKKDSTVIAPTSLPPKTVSGRGRRRVTRTSARNDVHEEDAKAEQAEDEVTVQREQAGNLHIAMTVDGGEDREVKGAVRASEDNTPGGRDSTKHAAENGCKEDQGGADCSSRGHSGFRGIPNTTSKYREDRKVKAHSTPFDVRVDRALKKYST